MTAVFKTCYFTPGKSWDMSGPGCPANITAKITSDGMTASNYSIPRWVDDLASSFVTAVLQTSKSRVFLILGSVSF